MAGEITDMVVNDNYKEVTFTSVVDFGVSAFLTLRNEWANGASDELKIKDASLSFKVSDHRSRTHFIADSLYALMGLSGPLKIFIPNLNIDLGLNFKISTSEITKFLQLRQTEFGLMVIEKACGSEFSIPEYISAEELNSISLAYWAILQQQFIWRLNEITQPTPATEEMLEWFESLKSIKPEGHIYKIMFGPSMGVRRILGQEVILGEERIFIDDAIIDNRDGVRRALAQRDGHIVPIRIRSQSRKARYVFSNVPRLPEAPWDEKIENFVKLEDALNEGLAARYHKLAASTVADLKPEEVEIVTRRPALDEDAHLIRD